jgi:hypothetical protein
MLCLEGGVDAASMLLDSYDARARTWKRERTGEFWDAVLFARQRRQYGRGRRIAVVDSGFDTDIPALAEQRHAWPTPDDARTTHGSAVALLILEVAPQATLDLYPVGVGARLDEDRVQRAVHMAADSDADVINLSFGEPFSIRDIFEWDLMFGSFEPWPDMTSEDVPFWLYDEMRSNHDWRRWFKPLPTTPISDAVATAVACGCTIFAAAGNEAGSIFSPALLPDVFAASHLRVDRTLLKRTSAPGTERAHAAPPLGYSQSEFSDFALVQPPLTLGSSFAAPLLSGFAALLPDRSTLAGHRDGARLASMANYLLPLMDGEASGSSDRREGVLNRIFRDAVAAAPHAHWRLDDDEACPECAALSAYAYVDAGLYWLKSGRIDAAERLLSAAALFAPLNQHAAANLAMTWAARADERRVAGVEADMLAYLAKAEYAMRAAVQLRPGYKPYEERATEFAAALREPGTWRLVR